MAVIEIVQFKTNPDVTDEDFATYAKEVSDGFASKQPGFISFEAASGENGSRLVVVRWEDMASAEASGAKFADDPASQNFLASVDMNTFGMYHYSTH